MVGEATHERDADWWLSGDGHWHAGAPPPGWIQAGDRRWYPAEPPETAQGYAAKWEATTRVPARILMPADTAYHGGSADVDATAVTRFGNGAYDDGLYGDGYNTYDDAYGPYEVDADDGDDPGYGLDDREGTAWPRWARVAVPLAALLAVAGVVVGQMRSDPGEDGAGVSVDATATTAATAGATTATSAGSGPLSPSVTATTRPTTTSSGPTTTAPRTTTTAPPRTTTTNQSQQPPPTQPDPGGPPGPETVRQGEACTEVGATATTANGTPMSCSTVDCNGDPYDEPRWRKTTC
jgi:hypothetical protein